MSLAAYKPQLIDNVGDKKEDMIKRNVYWVKDPGNYKELSKANKNSSGFKKNEKDDIKE